MMHVKENGINNNLTVADIVALDYRTAEVFRRNGITYCCGGKFPLQQACMLRGLDADKIEEELHAATRTLSMPATVTFTDWDPGFLVDYLLNVHHDYLRKTLPSTEVLVKDFVAEHAKKYEYLEQLEQQFNLLARVLRLSMKKEEDEIFPYIRQIVHAHKHKEPYAGLFIRTLRKPVEEALFKGHVVTNEIIESIRSITQCYTPPEKACLNHKVVLARLCELDNDLVQHIHLEESVLFPKVRDMEKELLSQQSFKPGIS
jgi:regulator of cell morphogenesis and NO signaling